MDPTLDPFSLVRSLSLYLSLSLLLYCVVYFIHVS